MSKASQPQVTITVTELKVDKLDLTRLKAKFGTDRNRKARVYAWPKDETILENFFEGRHNRPHRELQRQIRAVVDAALIVEGLNPQKWAWSQTAGCSCPCSPGWILTGKPGWMDCHNVEVYVTYTIEEVKQDTKTADR